MSSCQQSIVVPVDDAAMEALMLGVDYMHRCSQYCMPSSHYAVLLASDFFQILNRRLDILISDYESEIIAGKDRLVLALNCLDEVESRYQGSDCSAFMIVRAFILLALDCETCVCFFF